MSDNGFDSVPARYATEGGREAVDIMRDMCHDFAAKEVTGKDLGDQIFSLVAATHALKYELRGGKKGDREGDAEKHRWWSQMRDHAASGLPDPRSGRPGFIPYAPPKA